MDLIDLSSIFIDKSVQSFVPNYFKNCELPIICYKCNKPIRSAVFNFSKHFLVILVSKPVSPTPETARTLNMFVRLRVML